jgi:hypothetical protein
MLLQPFSTTDEHYNLSQTSSRKSRNSNLHILLGEVRATLFLVKQYGRPVQYNLIILTILNQKDFDIL